MGFFKKIAKPLAQIGASFIPGVGPVASKLIGGIGGAAADAFGSSGKQGQQGYNSQSQAIQDQFQEFNSTDKIDQFNEAIEDKNFTKFRNDLTKKVGREIDLAGEPIYGEAQKAKYISDLNDLAAGSMASLKGNLARTGRLDSGAADIGTSEIEKDRFGKASDFIGQLPFMESAARAERMNPLLGMAAGFAGRAPLSQRVTGSNTRSGTSKTTGTTNQTSNGMQTQFGPGFGKAFAGNLGEFGGLALGQMFKKKPPFSDDELNGTW
jgi:hypothetical protein